MKCVIKYLNKRRGLLFSLIYLLCASLLCAVLIIFDNDVKTFFYRWFNKYAIDKIAFLSIVVAIIVAIVTTLTLSISIEGNGGTKKFGKTPKELNEYLDYPISLNSAFVGLILYFVSSICLMKSGYTSTFYFYSVIALGYYLASLLIGLPVITGDSRKVYIAISSSLSTNNTVNSKDASNIVSYLFSKGYSIEEIYNKLNKKFIANQENVIKALLNLFKDYINNGSGTGEIFERHCKNFDTMLSNLTFEERPSIFIGCSGEIYSIIYAFHKKNTNVSDWVYHFAIKHSGFIKNKDNAALLEDVFFKFIALSIQNNEFHILKNIKRYICEFDIGTLFSKEARMRFFFLSFIFCVYLNDSKVPESYKNNIVDLITQKGSNIRFEELSWSNIFCKMVNENFDIDKNVFLNLLAKYEDRFEFTYYGKVYTPVVTVEHALRFYWYSLLCFSGNKDVGKFFVFNQNYDELHYFKIFINEIQNNQFKPCIIFSGISSNTNYIFNINKPIFDSINLLFSDIQKQKLIDDIMVNHKEQSEILTTCKKQIESSLSEFLIGSMCANHRHESFEFPLYYDGTFELDMNAKAISINAAHRVKTRIIDLLSVAHLYNKEEFDTVLENMMYKKKKIYINDTYQEYCNNNILKGLTKTRVRNAHVFTSPLFGNPTCFVSSLPYIGNISIDVYEKELNESDIEMFKNQYDNKAGVYVFRESSYTADEFTKIVRRVYKKIVVRIEFDYCLSSGAILYPFKR